MESMVDFSVFKGKTVLVTGHTGFKGSWLAIWLHSLGARVIGYSLEPYSERDNFVLSGIRDKIAADIRGDLSDVPRLHTLFDTYQPEIVFHLAAQPLVRLSYDCPVETYQTNVMGTIHVLEEIRRCAATRVGVMITTDKCYENREQWWGYREEDAMGGYDPYSSSKGAAELAISSWRRSFMNPQEYARHGKSIASVRAGNVVGGGDWAQDRIVPDCIRALESNRPIEIRSPKSVRPWQHVLEPLSGYLTLAAKMLEDPVSYCEGWNFGPNLDSIVPVWEVASIVRDCYGGGELKDVSDPTALHEAKLLSLDISKARFRLGWGPRWGIRTTMEKTVEWYAAYRTADVYQMCVNQIQEYHDNQR